MKTDIPIPVTQPSLPPLDEYVELLKDIWERKWLTNNGHYHQMLERALADYLGVKYVSLFCNGTIALQVGLQALEISGEVITTPFSFPATTHALWWNHCTPVFCDVDPVYGNLDPDKIEALITPKTTAILPVHVYGNPCCKCKIQEIADRHGLKVLYDAAHCFGVKLNGESVLNWGELSMVSFHATKVFNTGEGGALVTNDPAMKERIDRLKNFGFVNETSVIAPGINGKMNELNAALGLVNLSRVDNAIAWRLKIDTQYREKLANVAGIRLLPISRGLLRNGSYFPVFVDEQTYSMGRDDLVDRLKDSGFLARRYFFPLISEFEMYRTLPSANPKSLPNAHQLAEQVLCLPIYENLIAEHVDKILGNLLDTI